MPFGDFGMFVGADLACPTHGVPSDLAEFARYQRDNGRIASWRDDDFDALTRLVDLAGDVSDAAEAESLARSVLVHSDFNPKNILVDPDDLEVVGAARLGVRARRVDLHRLRQLHPVRARRRLVRADHEASSTAAPGHIRTRSARPSRRPVGAGRARRTACHRTPVRELATELLLAQARAGDLHAWPWDDPSR